MSVINKYFLILFPCVLTVLNLVLVFSLFEDSMCVRNEGVAFGIDFGFKSAILLLLLAMLILMYIKSRDDLRYNVLAISILGLGNFLERAVRGYICDYIQIFNMYVNLIDLGITVVAIFSLIYLFLDIYADKGRRRNKQKVR